MKREDSGIGVARLPDQRKAPRRLFAVEKRSESRAFRKRSAKSASATFRR
jgi:hypothetical protein